MLKKNIITCYLDTESVQIIGQTILIQYTFCESDNLGTLNKIHLHDVMGSPALLTCKLIEKIMDCRLVGFNLAHDIYHLNKTYNMCKLLPTIIKPEEDLQHWLSLEKLDAAKKYCLMPKIAIDLMIIGQRGKFKELIRQKPIVIKKVPVLLADLLVKELSERIKLNPLYFSGLPNGYKWKIKQIWAKDTLKEGMEIGNDKKAIIDTDFVNLVLPFQPKKGLKDIMKHIFNKNVSYFDSYAKKYKEFFWYPTSGYWLDVYPDWLKMWRFDPNQRKYAEDDVRHLIDLDKYFNYPVEDSGSVLACMVGNQYWRGYDVDIKKIKKEYAILKDKVNDIREKIHFNSPYKSLIYLKEVANSIIAETIINTKVETLERLKNLEIDKLSDRAELILEGRHADKRLTLLDRLLEAGKMYCQIKVTGTATNRMSGGSMEGKGESINPQGIPKEKSFRSCFTFSNEPGWIVSGGDAVGFEVAIACAVFGDDNLTSEVKGGKKFHAIFGSCMYEKTYNEIMNTVNLIGNKNLYANSKTGVFAWFYGGMFFSIAEKMNISEKQAEKGLETMEKQYPGIKKAREIIWNKFQALRQENGLGTQVNWKEPEKEIVNIFGFSRSFEAEIECIKALYQLAQNLPNEFKKFGNIKVIRRNDRGEQKAHGAIMSALYAGAFNLQSKVMRIASNFPIQSPGGEMIKELQYEIINKFQPRGIHEYNLIILNIHDEIELGHRRELSDSLEELVNNFVERYKKYVPLFKMDWRKNKKNWGETH